MAALMGLGSRVRTRHPKPLRYSVPAMGYNPHRKRVKRDSDLVFVGAAVVITAVLVIWGLFG